MLNSKLRFSHTFELQNCILQPFSESETPEAIAHDCRHVQNVQKQLFDIRVKKWAKHCAKRAKQSIRQSDTCSFAAKVVILIETKTGEKLPFEGNYHEVVPFNAIKDRTHYALSVRCETHNALGWLLRFCSNKGCDLPILSVTVTFQIESV